MVMSYPNRKRIRELTLEREQLCMDLEHASSPHDAEDIRAQIHEIDHSLFLAGFTSEYDQ